MVRFRITSNICVAHTVILAVAIGVAVVVATFVAVAARGILIAITAAIRRYLE